MLETVLGLGSLDELGNYNGMRWYHSTSRGWLRAARSILLRLFATCHVVNCNYELRYMISVRITFSPIITMRLVVLILIVVCAAAYDTAGQYYIFQQEWPGSVCEFN
jgi:hypothetical protein